MDIIVIHPPWLRCEFLAEPKAVEDALQYIKMYVAGV